MKDTLRRGYAIFTANSGMLIRYVCSGVSGIVGNLLVFSLLVEGLGVWYVYGAIAGFLTAYAITFTLHKLWTFPGTARKRTPFQSLLYLASALTTLALNMLILYALIEGALFPPVIAQACALFTSAVFSFVFTSQVTFHADESRITKLIAWIRDTLFHNRRSVYVLPLLLLVLLSMIAVARYSLTPLTFPSDAQQFADTAAFMAGDDGSFYGSRYLKPLLPATIRLFASIPGVTYEAAVLLQALVGYFALALAALAFGSKFFRDRWSGFLLALIVCTTYPMLRYGLDSYAETGAWTLYFLALLGTLLYYRTPRTWVLWLTALSLLAGLLWKEYAVLAGVIFGFAILFQPTLSVVRKAHAIAQGLALTIVPWLVWQYHVWHSYEYTYLDWLSRGVDAEYYAATYNILSVGKSGFMLLTLAWLLVAIGMYRWRSLEHSDQRFLSFMAIPSFGFLLWGWVSSRLFFSLVPFTALFAVHGLTKFSSASVQMLVVLCIGAVNFGLVALGLDPSIREFINLLVYGASS